MRRAAGRMRLRIENRAGARRQRGCECFHTATFTSEMVERSRRRIRNKTVRNLLNLAHYKFKLFIKNKAAGEIRADHAGCGSGGEVLEGLAAHPWS